MGKVLSEKVNHLQVGATARKIQAGNGALLQVYLEGVCTENLVELVAARHRCASSWAGPPGEPLGRLLRIGGWESAIDKREIVLRYRLVPP